jgi:hypothetical protein
MCQSPLIIVRPAANQVHPVPGRGDQARVRQCIHRGQFLEWHALVQVVDRNVADGPESSIDSAYELVHTLTKVLVLFDILTGRDGELQQDDLE